MKQLWTYAARDRFGKLTTGEVEAESENQVVQAISEQGLIPTKVNKRQERTTFASLIGAYGSGNRERLILFTRKLKTLYRAGVPLLRALSIIEHGAESAAMQEELKAIGSDLQSGLPLSKALARHPHRFPPMYIASVSAGEASGSLDEVLDQLGILIEKEMVLNRQVKSALRYPTMVIIAIAAAFFVLMSFVVPKFISLYGRFGADLPLPTKIVIAVSNVFSSYWYVILAVLAVAALALRKWLSTERGRLTWDEMILKTPLIGDLVIKANVARFASMLRILFKSGIPMVNCLNIIRSTTSNKIIASEVENMASSFERGREIGTDSGEYRYLPRMALEMLQVGLESGAVETLMGELATHYELELDYKSRNLTATIEPILTIIIGALVLVLALSIFLPMWNLLKVFN